MKLLSIVHVGWHQFGVQLNEKYEVLEFKAIVKDEELLLPSNSLGYEYLRRQFPIKAKEIDDFHIARDS